MTREIQVRVMTFNAVLNNILVYYGGQFYWWRKSECPGKTTDLTQVTEKTLSHECSIEYTSSRVGFKLTTLMMIGTDYIGI